MTESKTPLTDKEAALCASSGYTLDGCMCVSAELARSLETALAEKTAECKELQAKLDAIAPDTLKAIAAVNELLKRKEAECFEIQLRAEGAERWMGVYQEEIKFLKAERERLRQRMISYGQEAGRLTSKTLAAEGRERGSYERAAKVCFTRAEKRLTEPGRVADPTRIAQAGSITCAEETRALARKGGGTPVLTDMVGDFGMRAPELSDLIGGETDAITTQNAAGQENPVVRQVASDSCIGGVVSDSSPSVNSPAPAAPNALEDELQSLWNAYDRNEADLTRMGHWLRFHAEEILAALRQQHEEIPLKEEVLRLLVESESWKDNRDVESPAVGWMLKVPQKLFIRMISALKEHT